MTGDVNTPSYQDSAAELARVQFALNAAEVGTWDLDLSTRHVWWDDRSKQLFGIHQSGAISFDQAFACIHADDRNQVEQATQRALDPSSGGVYDVLFRAIGAHNNQLRWLRSLGRVYFNEQGVAYRFAGSTRNVTQDIHISQKLQASENRFSDLIANSPTPTAVYVSRDIVIQVANQAMLDLWGKDDSVLGKTLHDGIPELIGQPFLEILQQVYDTGEAYRTQESRADLVVNGQLQEFWFNFAYAPLFDQDGRVYGIINTATDITPQVMANRQLVKAQQQLQRAVDLAELATWRLDLVNKEFTCADRLAQWLGLETRAPFEAVLETVAVADRERIRTQFRQAFSPESGGLLNIEYRAINAQTGRQRLLHTIGRTEFDAQGSPALVNGVTQDVTQQRETQLALEALVQERTEEIAVVNEELAATNEELAASNDEFMLLNEELAASNVLLVRSNANLQQFAYIASHDLQEPLRKIQSFGDIILKQTTTPLDENSRFMLQRMVDAGHRMSTLVSDLLTFSRVPARQETFGEVSLQLIMADVLDTLDMAIEQAGADMQVAPMPIVNGDRVQLTQLFQNLISNALKFTPPDRYPAIRITYAQCDRTELPTMAKPTSSAHQYHRISVSDQGIGFDPKHLDRIFQVFQRLHGKSQYPGTGIGLAICQRVAENHGGAISAESQPDQGATFSVYLPA